MLLSKEQWLEAIEGPETDPPLTPEEKAKLQALGEKLLSLSPEERKELEKRVIEKYGII